MIDANGNYIPDDSSIFNTMPLTPPPQPQQPQQPGFFDRMGTGIKDAWNSGYNRIQDNLNDPRYAPGVNPFQAGLAGIASGFGQAAMPSRMPVPFGAALGMAAGGMQAGLSNANRQMGEYQQAQGQGIQNIGAASQLPLMLAKNKAMQGLYSNPQFQQMMMEQMGMGGGGQGAPSPAPQLGMQSSAGGGGAAVGNGGGGGGYVAAIPAALASLPDDETRKMTINALVSNNVPQAGWAPFIATVNGESGWDKKVHDNYNPKNGTYDVGLAQLNSSNFAKHGLDDKTARDPQANLNAGAKIFNANWQTSGGDPIRTMAGYNTGDPVNGAPPKYAPAAMDNLAKWAGGGGQADSGINPQNASALADQAMKKANFARMTGIGDPAVYEKQAAALNEITTAGPKAQASKAAEQAVLARTAPGIAAATKAAELPSEVQKMIAQAQIDTANAGPKAAAVAGNSNVDIREGGMSRVMGPDGKFTWVKNPLYKEGHDPVTGAPIGYHISPAMPDAPPGTPGTAEPVMGANGKPAILGPTIIGHEFSEKYGSELADQFKTNDSRADAAVSNNFLFDNLRRDSQTWQMGKFANIEGNARAWLSAAAHTVGVPQDNPTFKSLVDTPLADYQAFIKSSGSLLRTAVHETSPRASTQEYNMIEHTLPSPTSSAAAFNQVADQWQGINDYQIAKQTMQHNYLSHPQDFNTDFNANVTPHAFMLNRMAQSPQGQQDMDRMLRSMQETSEGRSTAASMLKGYEFAKSHNLFQNLPPSMTQQPAQ